MLISVNSLRNVWGVKPTGVLHVGAHEAEELDAYMKANWAPITWVEVQPSKLEILERKLPKVSNHLIEAAIWGTSGIELTLKITNNTESTSLLDLDTHTVRHPDVIVESIIEVTTTTLDDLSLPTEVEYLSLDIQGSELQALLGFKKGIKTVNWIYTEVNREELYKGCAIVEEIDSFLAKEGFEREVTVWTKYGWGDALYVRKGMLSMRRRVLGNFWIRYFYAKNFYFGLKHSLKMNLQKTPSKRS